jgi:FkbM family methyltransferase
MSSILTSALANAAIQKLHGFGIARKLAERFARGLTVTQPFHGGVICCDAVDHSWAWVHGPKYESFDRGLQDYLLHCSRKSDLLVDIGCNVGAMTLSCLLRNPHIRAVCLDPNRRAVTLLARSLKLNNIDARASLHCAAVALHDGVLKFDPIGSVLGHISEKGVQVPCSDFATLLTQRLESSKCLVKLDVEGYETALLTALAPIEFKRNMRLVVEVHPIGYNGAGDPRQCLDLLRASGAVLEDLHQVRLTEVHEDAFTQVSASWPR